MDVELSGKNNGWLKSVSESGGLLYTGPAQSIKLMDGASSAMIGGSSGCKRFFTLCVVTVITPAPMVQWVLGSHLGTRSQPRVGFLKAQWLGVRPLHLLLSH